MGSWLIMLALMRPGVDVSSPHPQHEAFAGPHRLSLAAEHAKGNDDVREAACVPVDGRPGEVEERCRGAPKGAVRPDPSKPRHWTAAAVLTAIYASAVAGAYATRRTDGGRAFPTTGGVIAGSIVGLIPGGLMMSNSRSSEGFTPGSIVTILGMVAGGIAGGIVTYRLTESPGSRAPTTAGTLAVPFLVGVAIALY